MRGLILSAYDAQSHRFWRENLVRQFSEISWHQLVLPPRYFAWRVRGNPLMWSADADLQRGQFDVCFATSMVDLATLRGLLPKLARVPTALYFHENQFAYPPSPHKQADIEPLMVQLYSSLSAERLCFNSEYNRDSFLLGVSDLLSKFPDRVPQGIVAELQKKAEILPVPLVESAPPCVSKRLKSVSKRLKSVSKGLNSASKSVSNPSKKTNSLIWNHRWEYDKGPERLLALIKALPAEQKLCFHVVGQAFRTVPQAFCEIKSLLEQRGWLGQWGYVEDAVAYRQLLAESGYVLSTALHDFQGLAVLEAVQQGCIPIVPDRLAYRELFEPVWRYASDANIEVEAQHLATHIGDLLARDEMLKAPLVTALEWPQLRPRYQTVVSNLMNTKIE